METRQLAKSQTETPAGKSDSPTGAPDLFGGRSWLQHAATVNVPSKRAISNHAATHLVSFGRVIQLGSGSTFVFLMEEIIQKQLREAPLELVILTTSLEVFEKGLEAKEKRPTLFSSMQIILTGGVFYLPLRSFVGKHAVEGVGTSVITPDVVFFGAEGLDFSENAFSVTYHFEEELSTQLAYATRPTDHRVILCDSSKIGKKTTWNAGISVERMMQCTNRCTIITNLPGPGELERNFRDQAERLRRFLNAITKHTKLRKKIFEFRVIDEKGAISQKHSFSHSF